MIDRLVKTETNVLGANFPARIERDIWNETKIEASSLPYQTVAVTKTSSGF